MAKIYEKDLYSNPDILYVFNKNINEYDIREAGYSLCREYGLLPDDKMKKLGSLSKKDRHVQIGKYQRGDPVFTKSLKEAFSDIRKRFLTDNSVDESKIIDIKKDAIFIMQDCETTQFGSYVDFRLKHKYTSYARLPSKIELFYSEGILDVKGIDDIILELHKNGIMEFLNTIFHTIETKDSETQMRVMMNYINKYKKLQLPLEYYREFNPLSKYIPNDPEVDIVFDEYWDDKKNELDIRYNYFEVLIPFLKMIL